MAGWAILDGVWRDPAILAHRQACIAIYVLTTIEVNDNTRLEFRS